MFLLNKETSSA